jgi:hypothetical protein
MHGGFEASHTKSAFSVRNRRPRRACLMSSLTAKSRRSKHPRLTTKVVRLLRRCARRGDAGRTARDLTLVHEESLAQEESLSQHVDERRQLDAWRRPRHRHRASTAPCREHDVRRHQPGAAFLDRGIDASFRAIETEAPEVPLAIAAAATGCRRIIAPVRGQVCDRDAGGLLSGGTAAASDNVKQCR